MNCFFFPMTFRYYPMASKNFPRAYLFPDGMFQLPNDIFRLPNVFLPKVILVAYFYYSSWYKNNHFRFSKTEKTNINNSKRKRRSVPIYRHCKFRKWKINGSYLSALIWVSKRIKCRYSGIKMHGGYQNAFFRAFLSFFWALAVNIHSGAFRYIPWSYGVLSP